MSDSITVCNSSCLIVLDAIGRLDLLQQLLGTITIPAAVVVEFGSPLPGWISVEPVRNSATVKSLELQLGPGESEAIALAGELSADRIILDDKKDVSDRSQSSRHIPCAVHRIPRRITVLRTAHGVCLLLLSDTSRRLAASPDS